MTIGVSQVPLGGFVNKNKWVKAIIPWNLLLAELIFRSSDKIYTIANLSDSGVFARNDAFFLNPQLAISKPSIKMPVRKSLTLFDAASEDSLIFWFFGCSAFFIDATMKVNLSASLSMSTSSLFVPSSMSSLTSMSAVPILSCSWSATLESLQLNLTDLFELVTLRFFLRIKSQDAKITDAAAAMATPVCSSWSIVKNSASYASYLSNNRYFTLIRPGARTCQTFELLIVAH